MGVLHSGILAAGLAAISIPILIHFLMRRRRKPVQWGAMRFVIEAYRRTRRRLLIERWLLLAARCLLVALIASALARPLLGTLGDAAGQSRTVYLLIDNSLPSQVRDGAGGAGGAGGLGRSNSATALDRHKAAARAVLDQLRDGDRAGLILLGRPIDAMIVPPSANLPAVRGLLDAVTPSESRADLHAALDRLAQDLARSSSGSAGAPSGPAATGASGAAGNPQQAAVVLLSDLLDGATDLTRPLPKLPEGLRLVWVHDPAGFAGTSAPNVPSIDPADASRGGAIDNAFITAIRPLRSVLITGPGEQGQTVAVTVARAGPGTASRATVPVELRLTAAALPATSPSTAAESRFGTALASGSGTATFGPGQREATVLIPLEPSAGASPNAGPAAADTAAGTTTSPLAGASGPTGNNAAVLVALLPGDRLPADDRFRLPIELRSTLRIGLIGESRDRALGSADTLRGSDWLALALRPAAASPLELVDLDPAALDTAVLAGLDALFVTLPDRVPEPAWPRLASFVRAGGLLLVTPPAEAAVHTWTDAFTSGLGLDWTIAREARDLSTLTEPLRLLGAVDPDPGPADLLAPIRGDLGELARPIGVLRVLPVTRAGGAAPAGTPANSGVGAPDRSTGSATSLPGSPGATPPAAGQGASAASLTTAATPLLALSDGTVWLWSARLPRAEAPAANPGTGRIAPAPGASVDGSAGVVLFMTSALDLRWTDLPAKPLMVPLVQELVRQGVGQSRPAQWFTAGQWLPAPPQSVSIHPLDDPASDGAGTDRDGSSTPGRRGPRTPAGAPPTVAVDDRGLSAEPFRSAGLYQALDAAGARRGTLAVNHDPLASRTDAPEPAALKAWLDAASGAGPVIISPLGAISVSGQPAPSPNASTVAAPSSLTTLFQHESQRSPIGSWLILFVLGLAIVELALARRASHAGVLGN